MIRKATQAKFSERLPRYLLAGFACVFLIIGTIVASSEQLESGSQKFVSGTLFKVGVVLGLAWLAAPQLERFGWQKLRGTLLVAIIIVIVLWSIRPRLGAIAGAVLIASTFLVGITGWLRQLAKPRR